MRLMAAAVVFSLFSIMFVACSGSELVEKKLDAPNIAPILPAFEDINARSTSALTPARNGSEFATEGLLPRRVVEDGAKALFEPQNSSAEGCAYAMYTFELTGYSGEQTLSIAWSTAPVGEQLWVALGNRLLDAWEWFELEPEAGLPVADIVPYLDEADMLLVVVLIIGDGVYTLDALYFTEFPPVIESVSPTSGTSGLDQQFIVTAAGLEPFTYAWDFGGGATPNVSADASPTVLMEAVGTHNASVTLTNMFGVDTFLFDLEVIDNFEPGTGQLIAEAMETTTQVGEPVQIVVSCGVFPHPFKLMNGVAITVEEGAEYVDFSFNVGAPGGEPQHVDGVWAHVDPTALLLPEDWLYTETPVTGEPGLIYIAFSVVPIGGSNTYHSGELFNFEMNFTSAGTYTLGFLEYQTVSRTFYSDDMSNEYYWNNITNAHSANTIVVSE